MAEAVRPRKKHRKKKEVTSSKKQAEDRTDELLQDEDQDNLKNKEIPRSIQEVATFQDGETLRTSETDVVQDRDTGQGETSISMSQGVKEEAVDVEKECRSQDVESEEGRIDPSLKKVNPPESEDAASVDIASDDTAISKASVGEKYLDVATNGPETLSTVPERVHSKGRTASNEMPAGLEGKLQDDIKPVEFVKPEIQETEVVDSEVEAATGSQEICDKTGVNVLSQEKENMSAISEEAKDAEQVVMSSGNSVSKDTEEKGKATEEIEDSVGNQTLSETRDDAFEILEDEKVATVPSEAVIEDGAEKEALAKGLQEEGVEATAPPEQEVQSGVLTLRAIEVGVHNPLQDAASVQVQPESLESETSAPSGAQTIVKTEASHRPAERIASSETEEDSQSSLLMRQESIKTTKVIAMKEDQLEMYYHNSNLKQQEQFVELFIQMCCIEKHEFYELVTNYFKARNNMLAIRDDIENMQKEYTSLKEKLWTTSNNFILAKGICADNQMVKENHAYQLAQFNPDVHCDLERLMKYTRSNFHDTFALCSYTAQLSKLQIESYIHQLFLRNSWLLGVKEDAPVAADLCCDNPARHDQIKLLKQCISVLFAFQRRPVNDEEFLQTSRGWLSRMIATLLRLATRDDHLFVLGHILRCPAGVDQWAACYLQIVMPTHSSQEGAVDGRWPYSLGNPLLDHFLNMLAFFMRPVKYRQEYLTKMKKSLTPTPSEKPGPFNWTLLDEDGEEDEDTDNTLFNENDLVAIWAQYPFDKMFKHVLQITDDADGKASYSVDRVGSHHMMQLIAFASSLIRILHQGVQTYNRSRYRQFVKRIGRLIRHTVQQVSDHWLNYRSWRREVCHDSDDTRPSIQPHDLQHTVHNLQVEFDEFFFRATKCIMSAPRLGTWQFMTDMPYTSLSSTMMWRLLWSLHQDDINQLIIEPGQVNKKDNYRWQLSDPVKRDSFVHKLMDMPMSEVIYLLTTFANMTSARPAAEKMFINFVVDEIYELSYLRTHTREFCSKIGRELLSAIATTHPFVISTLLRQVQGSAKEVGMMALYLFRGLPFYLWHPSNDDITIMKEWLLGYEASKTENQLARLVLSKMNWGYNEQEDALFLNLSLHRNTAVLVVEAYLQVLTAKSPGASRLGTGPFSSQEQAFDVWAWDLVPKLRLHKHHQPRPVLLAPSDGAMDDGFGVLPNPSTNTKLYPLQKALQTNVAVGCFVNVAMTKTGHSIDSFITIGIPNMHTLIQAGCQQFCLPLLAMVVPMFLDEEHPDYLLTNEKFLTIVHRILQADHQNPRSSSTGSNTFPGDTTKLFAGMVLTQIQRSLAPCTSALVAEAVLEFWLKLLTMRSGWHFDPDICYILDVVLSAAICNKGGCSIAEEVLLKLYKDMKAEAKPQGFISSVLSFVTSGNPLPSLLEKQSLERPWLAYCILSAETRNLEQMGLLREVTMELCQDADMTPDMGLKRACQKLKLEYSMTLARLPIYRWAQLALETDIEHPLLPIIWQRFFMIYLQRVTAETGISQRASIGQRYFQSIANLTYLKRMKKRLRQTADFHYEASRKKPAPRPSPSSSSMGSTDQAEGGEEGARVDAIEEVEFEAGAEHHRHLVQLYQTFLLWLEEPLLHDASLYLPSLPSQYEAEKLSRIFNGDQDLWMEYANVDMANYHTTQLVNSWVKMSQPDSNTSGFSKSLTSEQQEKDSATSRILNRLTHYEDQQKPPSVVPIFAPVPDVPRELLVNNHAMLVFLQDDIKQLLYYSDTFSDRENRNVVLDCEFLELVPDLFTNKDVRYQIQIPCKSMFNPMHKCKGPAVVTVTHKSKKTNEIISRRLDENRAEFKQLSIESLAPPPSNVVVSAVHIENAITDLIHFSRARADSPAEFEAAKQTGVSLLYHLGNQMSESARHYPPTRQFFSSCIEILGQEYIRPYPEQAQPLMSAILANCNLAGLLAPNLAPNHCGDTFVQMYSDVVRIGISDKQDTAFMLLTKFDPVQWLNNCQPVIGVRSQFIEVVSEALTSCSLDMDNRSMMMFEIYRSHLRAILMYQFPEHYGDVLRLILKGSEEHCLHEDIWRDTLKSISCPVLSITSDTISTEQVKELIQTRPLLSLQQLQETVEWLTTYFSRQRNNNPQSGQFGLHSNWKQYHQPLVSFLGYIILNTIILEAHRVIEANVDVEQAVRRLWTLLSGLFYPWIVALEVPSPTNPNAKQLLPPWVEGDRVPASCMVSMFSYAIGCIQAQFQGYLDPPMVNALSLLWPFYHDTLAKKGLREDVLMTYHQHLVQLPWNQFYPGLASMELMVRVFEDRGPVCLAFLGNIFPRIPWRQISDSYCQGTDANTSNCFLSNLLSLLVIFLNEDNIMKAQGASMQHLIAQVKEFPWQLLDVSSYNCAATWQIDRCDPKLVLDQTKKQGDTSVRYASSSDGNTPISMSLMRGVARFNTPSSLDSSADASKRAAYVNLVIRMLCKCSSLDDCSKDWFPAPVQRLLNDIELLATAGGSTADRQQELISLLSTLLSLLNNCSPTRGAPDAILGALLVWFEASTSTALALPCITAACRTLASIKHSALVVEACIEAHFNTDMDLSPDPSRGWTNILQVLQVPELTHDEFLEECSKQGAILTLFAYIGQRSPQCQTLEEEYTLYTELINWCVKCKLRPANEAKVFLWWHKALQMTFHQIEFGSPHYTMSRSLNNLIPTMMTLGEDRSSAGLLGAIGFGRQSELSYRFRVVARCMAAFVSAQVLQNGMLRLAPNDPGALTRRRDTQPQSPTSPDAPKPSSIAYSALKHLDAAIDNKNYVGLSEHAQYARDVVLNPVKCLKDATHLLSQLTTVMFPEKHYLSVIQTV
ncbi:ectopic P granules protein 5 homolog isoform X2 [Acanthaster planci]|uniref:Ectopic P granules protein 5 homolog isoform X2 n=1 Tax=Acanthaster planci TaxID=133434 RepID=A0A8B7ZSY5_ACAPL|nr:ectopic P granules protein 5 homolog isoform X2 [Acanthaster planci]